MDGHWTVNVAGNFEPLHHFWNFLIKTFSTGKLQLFMPSSAWVNTTTVPNHIHIWGT